jgi:hypothetical protein
MLMIVLKNIKKMNKIPTAEEFQRDYSIEYYDESGYQGIEEKEVSKMLIKFAKLHVEMALKEANKKAIMTGYVDSGQTILNAYTLENIK